jgi:phage FluMu protein Com
MQRIRCFKCNELGHKSSDCPRHNFVNITQQELEGDYEEHSTTEEDCNYEVAEEDGEEMVCVVRRLLYTPAQAYESRCKRIFEGKCSVTIRVSKLVIDSCNCENLVSQSLVEHLKLKTQPHPALYNIGWIKKGPNMKITQQCYLPLSLGKTYRFDILCDVVEMDACHVLLGRPWQFDVDATHRGRDKMYVFSWNNKQIIVVPSHPSSISLKVEEKTLLSVALNENEFMEDMKKAKSCVCLIVKGMEQDIPTPPEKVHSLLAEFEYVLAEPTHLPLMRDIQHRIDFVPGASLSNLPHYRMSP